MEPADTDRGDGVLDLRLESYGKVGVGLRGVRPRAKKAKQQLGAVRAVSEGKGVWEHRWGSQGSGAERA